MKQIPQEKSGSEYNVESGSMFEGLPYRGPTILIKENDPESRLPVLTHQGYAKQFILNDAEQLKEYEAIIDKVIRGLSIIGQKRIVYDRDLKSFVAFVEWADQFYTAPPTQD